MQKIHAQTYKHYIALASSLVILVLLSVAITQQSFFSLDFKSSAAVNDGVATISYNPSSSDVIKGSAQQIEVFATTAGKEVVGFQLVIVFDGTIPSDIVFVPEDVPDLQVIRNQKSRNGKRIEVVFVVPPQSSEFTPFVAESASKLGQLEYTVPDQNGYFRVKINKRKTLIVEHLTHQDIALRPRNQKYTFVNPPVSSPSPTPSPVASVSPSPSPSISPTPSPSPLPSGSPNPLPSPIPLPTPIPAPTTGWFTSLTTNFNYIWLR